MGGAETTNQEITMFRKKTSSKSAIGMSPDKLAKGLVELNEKELDAVASGVSLNFTKITFSDISSFKFEPTTAFKFKF